MTSILLAARSMGTLTREAGRTGFDRTVRVGSSVPLRGAQVRPRWLEQVMGLPAESIRSLEVADEDSGTASRVRLRIEAEPDSGAPEHVFLKLAPHNFAQRVMMNLADLALREVLFYKAVGPEAPVRVPRCYHAELDARRGRSVMIFEDLGPTAVFRDVRDSLTPEQAEAVVDALADLHARYWESERFDTDLAPLRSRGAVADYLGEIFVRKLLAEPKHASAELVPPELVEKSRVLWENFIEVNRYWTTEPQTLLHGDTHLGNLFFEGEKPGFLDWQATMIGAGIRDVAYFTIASVDPAVARKIERGLVGRYAERLGAAGIEVDVESLWLRYRAVAADFYVAAVTTAGSSDRMQIPEISRVGVVRAVAAVEALDTFDALAELVGIKR